MDLVFKSPKEHPDVHPLSAAPEGGFQNSWDGERQFDGWSLCPGPGICDSEKGHIGGRGRADFTFILSRYYKTVVLFQFHFMPSGAQGLLPSLCSGIVPG